MPILQPQSAQNHSNPSLLSEGASWRPTAFADAVTELHSSLDLATAGERAEAAASQLLGGAEARVLLVIQDIPGDSRGALVRKRGVLGEVENVALTNATVEGRVALSGRSEISEGSVCVALRSVCGKGRGRVIGVLVARGAHLRDEDRVWLERLSHPIATSLENARLHGELRKGFLETAEALVEAIEKKDRCTGGHAKRVAHYAVKIGCELELESTELEELRLGALLHDVGKIGIEDRILKKEADLEGQEWSVMRSHPELGYQILKRISGMGDVVDGMRFHHERWDGTGYPLGLKGEDIPRIARIISVADAYDAMISSRPYRRGMASRSAVLEIREQSGTQFDPEVVAAFERAFLEIANP